MTALPVEPPIPPPNPAQVAAALQRHHERPRLSAVPPSVLAELPTAGLPSALVRDRANFCACSAGRHEWVDVEITATWSSLAGQTVRVCLHCPVRADQAAAVRAAAAAKATR